MNTVCVKFLEKSIWIYESPFLLLFLERRRVNVVFIQCDPAGSAVSYSSLIFATDNLSVSLTNCGVERGDYVCTLLTNSIQFIILSMATSKIGAILCPFNPALKKCESFTFNCNLPVWLQIQLSDCRWDWEVREHCQLRPPHHWWRGTVFCGRTAEMHQGYGRWTTVYSVFNRAVWPQRRE